MHRLLIITGKSLLLFILTLPFQSYMYAQQGNGNPCTSSAIYLYWTGEANNDFFNEQNWRKTNEIASPGGCLPGANSFPYTICTNAHDTSKDNHPDAGALDAGVPVRYNLLIENSAVHAEGSIIFACPLKGLTIIHTQLNIANGTMNQGVLSLLSESTVHFREGAMSPQLILNFLDTASWVYMHQESPASLITKSDRIRIGNSTAVLDSNFRINQYYQAGSVIRPFASSFAALKIYTGLNLQGNSAALNEDIIYSAADIPGGLNKASRSFLLKRGFMATMAVNSNGTGKSKVFIAADSDLVINEMNLSLQGNVSFIRVVPWNWVTKKGTGGLYDQLNAGWFYNWNNNGNPQPNYDYVPMAWGASGALPPALNQVIQKKRTTHVLGFNESDNCNDQSGQYNNLCQPAVAVAYYENLMGLGLRLGTPAARENGPTTWLLEFARIAKQKDVRFDFVAVHWYDWGSNPAASPNADPLQIFNRFKAYLANVYKIYQLPVWITEFNANPNRGNAIQEAFLGLAMPYLDSLEYVERYAYFQPNAGNAQNPVSSANFLDDNGNLTNIGELYKNLASTPSIPFASYACPNNLEGLDLAYTPSPVNSLVFEAECGKYHGNQWQILDSTSASNSLYTRGDNTREGLTALSKQVHFEFELQQAGTYRTWIRSATTTGQGAIRIQMDGNDFEQISPFTSSTFTWFQVPRFYDLGEGKHRLSIEFPNTNIMIDQVAVTSGPENLELFKKDSGYCTPATLTWGLDATDFLDLYEAESAAKGVFWKSAAAANAAGGAFAASEENIVSAEAPDTDDKVLSFSFNIEKSDEYDIWAKIQANNPSATGLWISVDDEPFRKWSNLRDTAYAWYWKKFHYSYPTEDRSFTYFLQPGEHLVKIAIASGNVYVDRLAVATKGKLPETTDPNVLLVAEKLEFEAEDATLLGAATVVICASSSNGKQVNLLNVNSNMVRFSQIVAASAGAYKLKIAYMSAALRSFRILVNGVALGKQNPPVSGAWCFNGGSPGIYEVGVVLNRGINIIDISPFIGDAPFIDKIKLEKLPLNGLSLEAETAELIGANTLVSCATASNGALVNMGLNVNNGIRFNNLLSSENSHYTADIYYITKTDRNMRMSVNGQPFTTASFSASGNWCYEGGTTKIKTVDFDFLIGTNTLEFKPTGSDAPFIDKIVIKEIPADTTNVSARQLLQVPTQQVVPPARETITEMAIYPNPLRESMPITISLPAAVISKGVFYLQITDITGRVVFSENMWQQNNTFLVLRKSLHRGMYIFSMTQGSVSASKKIIVQ